ncbi:MAG: diacylglycerol kinase family lipid kinase, partial [Bacteroidales bacterium]|nr:diacylglycerol kinase family lipid kinase [Bacteroidales bacterium]
VAVGGDGTMNEVSQGLIKTQTTLGIIPTGSGNGLARYLKIPLSIDKAILNINKLDIKLIDTVEINNYHFVNMAGVGFDGHISHKFAEHGKRGVYPYFKLSVKEFFKYKAKKYRIKIDGEKFKKRAFVISIANSSEYGFEAHIAPRAIIDDGLIDVTLIEKFPAHAAPNLGLKLFTKRIEKNKYTQLFRGKKITIKHKNPILGHMDGEPINFGKKLKIKIHEKSLRVIVGEKF